jgi:hypothetical protein
MEIAELLEARRGGRRLSRPFARLSFRRASNSLGQPIPKDPNKRLGRNAVGARPVSWLVPYIDRRLAIDIEGYLDYSL